MKSKVSLYLYLYYLVLLVVFVSRKDATTEPSLLLRLPFLLAVVAPCIFNKSISYPAIITLFYTLTVYGFAYSYMPYTLSIYFVLTLAIFFLFGNGSRHPEIIPKFLVFFAIYIFIIDLITGFNFSDVSFIQPLLTCLLLVVLMLVIIGDDKKLAIRQFSICFAIVTIVLCYAFLANRTQFSYAILFGEEKLERTGWTDPNYFGMVLGMGAIIGIVQLFGRKWNEIPIFERIIYLAASILSIPVLVLNASRGALLSLVLAFAVLLMFSKTKSVYKLLVVIFSALFIYYLYTNQYFELLEHRIQHEDGTGSERTVIWMSKLDAYLSGNPLNTLLGYGHHGGVFITGIRDGFHNDFLAFLVCYGLPGITMLLYMLYYPIKIVERKVKQRPYVIVFIVYLATCFLTLEPFSSGFFAFFLFYLYVLIFAYAYKGVGCETLYYATNT